MESKLYVPDISCESCTKLISRRFNKVQGIHAITRTDQGIIVNHDPHVSSEYLVQIVQDSGFRASTEPLEQPTLKEQLRLAWQRRTYFKQPMHGLMYAGITLIILTILFEIAYLGIFQNIPNFLTTYSWWLSYLSISVVALGFSLWHFFSYRTSVNCMTGMMIGMTMGMQTGMMLGAVVGATNGFFTGAMVDMLAGVAAGIYAGRCCGIMGTMEGMMAGLMGGTMGPMISLMMFTDRILLFMPVYMLINIAILVGLNYMLAKEFNQERFAEPMDAWTFAAACIIITALLVSIMVWGPTSPLLI